jgi:integrase
LPSGRSRRSSQNPPSLNAHAHRFRHTLATELLGCGAGFDDVADILGKSPEIVRKHYAKWSPGRQARIDELLERVHSGADYQAAKAINEPVTVPEVVH